MKTRIAIAIAFVILLGCGLAVWMAGPSRAEAVESKPLQARVFQLRTYTTHPGKLDDLHARFRNHTNRLFVKHGITLIGYWTPAEGPESENTLIYIIAHESMEAAKKSWAAFRSDPEWKKVYAQSRTEGPIVKKVESKFLIPTDYSPLR